jgi:hypothetical protein
VFVAIPEGGTRGDAEVIRVEFDGPLVNNRVAAVFECEAHTQSVVPPEPLIPYLYVYVCVSVCVYVCVFMCVCVCVCM